MFHEVLGDAPVTMKQSSVSYMKLIYQTAG